MAYLVVVLVALAASALTFFAGFGLGTVLLPAFALFFPLPVAIALTAVVHLLNNLFKLTLVGRHAHFGVVLRFGLPGVLAAFLGARALVWLSGLDALCAYRLAGRALLVTPVKLVVAALMVFFALVELSPRVKQWSMGPRYLPLGGIISGFFGGLSGHQGAFRSAFLLRVGLGKEEFIATGVFIAIVIDLTRIPIYLSSHTWTHLRAHAGLLGAATLAAFMGALFGNWWLKKVTLRAIQIVVTALLVALAAALAAGLI